MTNPWYTAPDGLVPLADIRAERVEWLWPGRIPCGALTVVDGDPGLGKSTVLVDIAARVSTGTAMPGSNTAATRGGADVLFLSAEDSPSHTLRPRLEAAGGDLARVHVFGPEAEFQTLDDHAYFRAAIEERSAKLVVIDPFVALLPSFVDAFRDQEIRSLLRPFAVVAGELGCAIVLIRHLTKAAGPAAIYRGGGSIGIIAAARSGLLLAKDPRAPSDRVLASIKSNLGPPPPALGLRVVPHGETSRIEWLGETDLTADQLVAPPPNDGRRIDEAADFLRAELANGPVSSKDLYERAKAEGVTERTLQRAKRELAVKSFPEGAGWSWRLPTTAGKG
ncbi:MAG: AAA family ATPase [Dehalococcoidia bacterium]